MTDKQILEAFEKHKASGDIEDMCSLYDFTAGFQAGQAAQEPDMIWDKDDPESNYGDCLWSFAREYNAQTDFEGDLEVMVAVSLPNRIMRIKQISEDERGYRIIEAEWVGPTPDRSE